MKLNDIEQIIKARSTNIFKLSWELTRACNYRCPYCYQQGHQEYQLENTQETMEAEAKGISLLLDEIKRPTHLHLIGGEPTLYDLLPILKSMTTPYLYSCIIVSNFSRPLEYYTEIIEYCNSRKISMTYLASFHIEETEPRKHTRPFIEKVIALKNVVRVKVVVTPENMEDYRPYVEEMVAHDVPLSCSCARDLGNNANEDKKVRDFVEHYNSISEARVPFHPYIYCLTKDGELKDYTSNTGLLEDIEGGFIGEGFECTAGIDIMRVNKNGDITAAPCHTGLHNKIGNVLTGWTIPTKPVICDTKTPCNLCYFTDIRRIHND